MVMSNHQHVLRLARAAGVLRPRDLEQHRLPRRALYDLVARGELTRVSRGMYRLRDADVTENHSLAEVAKRLPRGVICLLSALRFHELTTELPAEVWIAIGHKAWAPRLSRPRVRIIRLAEPSLSAGTEVHLIEGVPVRVFSVAKTIADCFKFRNKIGVDVAVEALREAWMQRRVTADEIWSCATVNRVTSVMRPYLESLQ